VGVTKFPEQRNSRADSPKLVHQFLIALSHVDPLVWRRIQVPQSYTFWDLHVAIQDAMGWEDRHLHEFRLFDDQTSKVVSIGLPTDMMSPDRPIAPGWTVPLSRHFESREWLGLPILYAYDFGDGWEHALIHEGMQTAKRSAKYPRCVSGARRCPPEDCGGPHGYAELLKIIASPKHPQHKSMIEWIGGAFDPDSFDPKRVAFDNPKERWTKAFRQ
jgi:hypothetical protein